jgi:holin-like protein
MASLRSVFILLFFQLVGEALGTVAHLPVPGPVLGMALLAAWYILRRREPDPALQETSNHLLSWLGLLFIPAGVGIIANLALLRSAWLPISIALLGSTLFTLLITGWVMQRFGRSIA